MVGLNVRAPFARLLANGTKKIETRRYKVPDHYLGHRIAIIETGKGKAKIIGSAELTGWYTYRDRDHWHRESGLHLVERGSDFDWLDDSPRYGWKVSDAKLLASPVDAPSKRGLVWCKGIFF